MNKTEKPDTVNDLHKPDNHSEKVYEAEALQTAFYHSGSNTENLVTLNSTPSSTPVSTTEPKLTIQTEDVPDKAATSVSVVQSTDYLSTTTTVAEAHKTTETESHSSKVNNTESQSDPTQSTTESNVSIIAKTVEMLINIPKAYN